jgi:hypothetical protein
MQKTKMAFVLMVLLIGVVACSGCFEKETDFVEVTGIVREYMRGPRYNWESENFIWLRIDGAVDGWYLVQNLPMSERYGFGGGVTYTPEMFAMALIGMNITFSFIHHPDSVVDSWGTEVAKEYYTFVGIHADVPIKMSLGLSNLSNNTKSNETKVTVLTKEQQSILDFNGWLKSKFVIRYKIWMKMYLAGVGR